MTYKFYYISLTLILTTLFSCKKEINSVPSVQVIPVTNVTLEGFTSGGEVTDEGGVPVTSRGICWGTSQNPTVQNNKTLDGYGPGKFTSSPVGLAPGTTYYVRAYAINNNGVGYSSQISFSTSVIIPSVTTSELTNVTGSSAAGGGEITSDGGALITARGLCWSTSPNPTTSNSKTIDGSGSGKFNSSVTGLNPGTIYYFRAYATNSAGTAYGSQVSAITVTNAAITDGAVITLQKSTIGKGIDLVFLGDGYTVQEISSKKYENNIRTAVSSFFNIEPYKSYSSYFNVYMVYAFSEESGISDLNNTVKTKFETKYTGASNATSMSINFNTCLNYARKAPVSDVRNTVAVLIANSTRYGGTTYMNSGSMNIAICPMPQFFFSHIVQHEGGGHAFGNLADEYVNKTGMIPQDQIDILRIQQGYGIFRNVDVTGVAGQTVWSHFIGLPKYSYVSTYEGAFLYPQGVWRPESNSIMVNNVRYFNAPSREIIVKRIMKIAGITYSFDSFQSKDVMEYTKSAIIPESPQLAPPVIMN